MSGDLAGRDTPRDAAGASFTVVIATRNRSDRIVATLDSVFANGTGAEVIVVDQSDGRETEQEVGRFSSRAHFHYLRSASRGCSAGRNVGAARASRELIAFTDDDCLVEIDWLERIGSCFAADARIGVVFGAVVGEAGSKSEIVTSYRPRGPVLARRLADKHRVEGIAGCMAMRRSVWDALGGFDELMGVGAAFQAGEETDLAVRVLTAGHFVYESPDARVVHTGSVSAAKVPALVGRYWFGTGAAFGKSLARRPGTTTVLLLRMAGRWAFGQPPVSSSLGGGLHRWPRLRAFVRGLAAGVRQPVDPATGRFIGWPSQ